MWLPMGEKKKKDKVEFIVNYSMGNHDNREWFSWAEKTAYTGS